MTCIQNVTSKVQVVKGSSAYQKAFRIDSTSKLRMSTKRVFWKSIPLSFSLTTTFRLNMDSFDVSWYVFYIQDHKGRIQFGLQVNPKRKLLRFKLMHPTKRNLQNFDLSLDNEYFAKTYKSLFTVFQDIFLHLPIDTQ
ncbi:hypothetical protein HELRODRAFT_170963 [Helobdella robusta]|uniref:Uncharacterized protein n=1 Tax=Helobdella robusta TaxID=6412 RepID=T1F3M7_HELRO|nr:hypothetical protein HELRODRAFT_170963 [Helobdella robusta]ESO06928.1 hypothetical protein HELRODRAFT_170963 [Helobdella robusta]